MQTLVDASVWIDYFTGRPTREADWLDARLGNEALVVSDVALCEVLCGLPDERNRRLAQEALMKFWQVEMRGLRLAVQSAVHYHTLKARGIETRPAECLTATFCLEEGFQLLHRCPGYAPFERHLGLRVPRV